MFGSRWRAYASPIRALFEAAKPELVARIMSGAMENAVARRLTPEAVLHQARELLPDELPLEPGSAWTAGFEAAAKLSSQELLSNAKAFDEASKRWSSGRSRTSTFTVKLSEAALGEQLERIREQLRGDRLPVESECWADYALRMRAANERALEALRSRDDRDLRDAEVMLSDALGGEGPAFEDEREFIERWISSLHARRLTLLGDGPPVYDRVEEDANPRRHEWAQLRACGMLYMANTVLHAFGWSIVVTDDGAAYPARTSSRGFTEATQAQAHHDIASYLRLGGDAMVAETEPEEGPW
jgi:hypothetical protein